MPGDGSAHDHTQVHQEQGARRAKEAGGDEREHGCLKDDGEGPEDQEGEVKTVDSTTFWGQYIYKKILIYI